MLSNFFPKIVSFMRECRKIWSSQRGCRWQNGGALHAGYIKATRAQAHVSAPALISTHARTHPRTHESKRALAQTDICNAYCFSTATVIHESALMLRYTKLPLLFLFLLGVLLLCHIWRQVSWALLEILTAPNRFLFIGAVERKMCLV